MNILIQLFLTIICLIMLLYDLKIWKESQKYNIFNSKRKIKENNKILFYKLKKQYLNNISNTDIIDLICFLINELKERKLNNDTKTRI